jgi:hypothetical protein
MARGASKLVITLNVKMVPLPAERVEAWRQDHREAKKLIGDVMSKLVSGCDDA